MDSDCFPEEFLLTSPTGSQLYHNYEERLPIVNYHCHLEAREICEGREFKDSDETWLVHGHYRQRAICTFGISERCITGTKSYYEKFLKFVQIIPHLAGDPLYIWYVLELKRYFDVEEPLGPDNAEEIYRRTSQRIRQLHITPGWCLEQSGVELPSITEDPADSLEYHMKIKENAVLKMRILTAFRPDRAFYCERGTLSDYMKILSQTTGQGTADFSFMTGALEQRLAFFAESGTTVNGNGIAHIAWEEYTEAQAEDISQKAAVEEQLSEVEISRYKSAFLIGVAKLYKKYHFMMQLHIGIYLNVSHRKIREIGQSTGFDCMDDSTSVKSVGRILDRLTEPDQLPKTIPYPLNPVQAEPFTVLAADFYDDTVRGKIWLGAP